MLSPTSKFISLLIGLFLNCFSLASAAKGTDSICAVTNFAIDPFGNCYFLKGDEIIKTNILGAELVRYSRKDLGEPTSFDVNNPMRLLVFYAPFAVIRILDNNLIDQSEINLRELGVLQPKVMAGTPDQGIWIYDEISGSLLKIDTRLKSTAISVDLNQLLAKRPQPIQLLANQQWLVLRELNDIMVFDQFGTKIKSIHFDNPLCLLQLDENILSMDSGEGLITYDLRLNSSQKSLSPCPEQASKSYISEGKLWFIRNQCLHFPQ